MRAFLSHSSADKGLVEKIALILGGSNTELDSLTFEEATVNAQAVQAALKRSSVFVLFASEASVDSPYVNFESLRAEELNARGIIDRILVICIDNISFLKIRETLKHFNVVRTTSSLHAIARLIQHQLLLASTRAQSRHQPFVGRNTEIAEAKDQLIDPARVPIRAIFVSGNAGIGRRTFVRKLYSDVFPYVRSIFPEIELGLLDGYAELFRKLIDVNTPIVAVSEFKTLIETFDRLDEPQKAAEIANNIAMILGHKPIKGIPILGEQ
ncbi:MAG TPA: toll/interleukin-1 receptor domain-containing protein [Xanthobacteraceae bacterium]|nr:toll/interleukin-1 receptor domain-containing protein [Xanthobacteraceae bacterium]